MDRRIFLYAAAASLVAGASDARVDAAPPRPPTLPAGWRLFELTTRVALQDAPGAAQLWLPLAQTAGGYQTGVDVRWATAGGAEAVRDSRYGAEMLRVTWDDASADAPKTAEITQLVATRDRMGADPALPIAQAERAFWAAPTERMPTPRTASSPPPPRASRRASPSRA
jgi:hypothetical protein